MILEFSGLDGFSNAVTNPPDIEEHLPVRVILDAGNIGQDLVLTESSLSFVDDEGIERNIYLPAVSISPFDQEQWWVSVAGSTYVASAGQTEPDFSVLARGSPVPWSVIQPGFRVELVATGFQLPVNIAFIANPGNEPGDPLFYVTELYGTTQASQPPKIVLTRPKQSSDPISASAKHRCCGTLRARPMCPDLANPGAAEMLVLLALPGPGRSLWRLP